MISSHACLTCTGELMSVLLLRRSEGAPCVVWLCANVGNRSACWLVGTIIVRRTLFYSFCTSFRTALATDLLEALLLRPRTGLGRLLPKATSCTCPLSTRDFPQQPSGNPIVSHGKPPLVNHLQAGQFSWLCWITGRY